MGILSELNPKRVFELFEYLSTVPHGSGNTKMISDLIVTFAKINLLRYVQDDLNNVVIYAPATEGYENADPVILQAHMDMVCAKRDGDPLDMSVTPIKLMTDGEWVWADGTSLGGDDTIGVACILALLEDKEAEHPALETVITVDEETGMNGAVGIDASLISGRRMLNLDSEEDGVFTCGCAGGKLVNCTLPVKRKKARGYTCVSVTVSGLLGGHSGGDIHLERGNSHLLTVRFLREAARTLGIRLISIDGGKFDNVIPSMTEAVAAVPEKALDAFLTLAKEYDGIYKAEYQTSDPGVTLEAKVCECDTAPMTDETTKHVLRTIALLPCGVQNMSPDIAGLTETSLSMGIIKTNDDSVYFCEFVRSSVDTRKELVADKVITAVELAGGTVSIGHDYPGWAYKKDSPIRDISLEAYRAIAGTDAVISATHGGLECGLFSAKLTGLDCIAFGPELYDIHSVRERVNVASVAKMYKLICEIVRRCK